MSDQLAEEKNIVKIKQMIISELKECLHKKDSENEHQKSKIVDFTTSVNESLNSSVEELSKARTLAEVTLRERDEVISDECNKMWLLEEQYEPFYEVPPEFDSEIVHDTQDSSEKDVYSVKASELLEKTEQMKSQVLELLEKLKISDQEMKHQIILFKKDKRMFLAKNEFFEKVSSSAQKEYNDLLASNDVLKQRLKTKFKFLKHDNSLEKMIEMIEKEYESNVSKIFITSSMFESKNLKLVKEMRDKMKCFYEEKKVFETKISKLEKVLAQQVKDFDDVKTKL
nr:hypothetical protein [Tanacetum cinerariifolium]